MKFPNEPTFSAKLDGVWGVDAHKGYWYVVHRKTLRAKRIGIVGARHTNYFDEAIAEADRRNQKEQ